MKYAKLLKANKFELSYYALQAKFVVLADDCTEESYKKLVVALAK